VCVRLTAFVLVTVLCLVSCHQPSRPNDSPPIVGAWLVTIPEAPFPYHLLIFHADGTVHQSNPDAGDANTSDSALMGAWTTSANGIKAKLVEVTADRNSHKFVSRVEISFWIQVSGDAMTGTATAVSLDREGKRIREAVAATLSGQRILPD